MAFTIYRKYRPKCFKDIINQSRVKITLENELETGRIAHAYLFCGPRGIGKTTIARIMAKALNCQKRKTGQHEPCNDCPSCAGINDGRSLDLVEIDAASNTGVDNVRENIINNSRVVPVSSAYKVFIIDEVHMLSASAFNALLKTLEEPPNNVVFILATTEIHKVPQTIISRCQRFDFRKVGVKEIAGRLEKIANEEKIKVDPKVLLEIAVNADGSMRDAESALGQVFSLGEKEITMELAGLVIPRSDMNLVLEFLEALYQKNAKKSLEIVNRLSEEGMNVRDFNGKIIEVLRKAALRKISASFEEFSGLDLDEILSSRIKYLSETGSMEQFLKLIKIFLEADNMLKYGLEIVQLPLEIAALEAIEYLEEKTGGSGKNQSEATSGGQTITKNNSRVGDIGKSDEKEIKIQIESPKKKSGGAVAKKLELEDIKKGWSKLLKEIGIINHTLALTLSTCEAVDLNNNGVLTLCFGFRFHQERVWENKNKIKVEEALEKVFDAPLCIKCTVDENLRNKHGKINNNSESIEESSLKDALDAFGGEVVNI